MKDFGHHASQFRMFFAVHCLVALVALWCWMTSAMARNAASLPPPMPTEADLLLPYNQPVMVGVDGELSWLASWNTMKRWNPATGVIRWEAPTPGPYGTVITQLPLPVGLLVLANNCLEEKTPQRSQWCILFLPASGGASLKLKANESFESLGDLHYKSRLIALGDDAAALITLDKNRHIQIHTIRRKFGRPVLEKMPPLSIAYRGDFAAAPAGKDRLMILGGSDAQYRGCFAAQCRAETHILDVNAKSWHDGPPMLEARSELAASALPDGSILVTGGWTKDAGWDKGPSRSAERWNPQSNQFEALPSMPAGNALHRHLWWKAPWGNTLLVVPGITAAVHAFDPSTRAWHTAGEWPHGSEEGSCGFFPFTIEGNAYAWLRMRSEGFYSSKRCGDQKNSILSLLRPPHTATLASQPPSESLLTTRAKAAFLPATDTAPALAIGGATHFGRHSDAVSAAVDAIDWEGRMTALPPLRVAREGAQAFRVAGGVLVIGGLGRRNDDPDNNWRELPPAEWLPPQDSSTPWQWQEADSSILAAGMAVTSLKDGSLLAVGPGKRGIQQLRLVFPNGKPTLESQPWPTLNHEREGNIQARELDDGRIVVAGGSVRSEKIALYSERALEPDHPDEYIDIGPFLPSRRHEIFDPAIRRWSNSAPSKAVGGWVIILADGRVIKAGREDRQEQDETEPKIVLEISNSAGTAWTRLATSGSRLNVGVPKLFSVDGELFASGHLPPAHTSLPGLEWLNPTTGEWELLWQGVREWQGARWLVRSLTGADGKRKTIVIPVGGL